MRIKKFVALALSAALALTAFAGCGRKDLEDLLLGLLEGQYQNVTVSGDAELENTLRRAVGENHTIEGIIQDLEQTLGLTIRFERLASGQQGDHTFRLVFQPGSDPDAAARETFLDWDPVFDTLPADGQYDADIAVMETENGYYILVQADVNRAGSHSSGSHDDDGGSANPPAPPAGETYQVGSIDELKQLIENNPGEDFADDTIQLADGTYTVTQELLDSFAGTLTVQPGAEVTIELEGTSLFGTVARGGAVDGIDFEVTESIRTSGDAGTVALKNEGTIQNCTVTIPGGKYIQGTGNVGGVASENSGAIQNTTVTFHYDGGNPSQLYGLGEFTGGIAGLNMAGGEIENCTVGGDGGRINGTDGATGGLVGCNQGAEDSLSGSQYQGGGENSINGDPDDTTAVGRQD